MFKEPDARDKRPSGVLLVLAVVGALTLIAAMAFMALALFAIKLFPTSASLDDGEQRYLGHHSFSNALAGVKIEGAILPEMAEEIVKKLNEAAKDKRVKGILLDINSPGGSVVASQEIYDTINRIKEKMPVVGYMREVAASGAYYSTASANWLMCNRGTMVGSIGVILDSFEATQLIDWMKLKPVTLKTGRLKDSGSVTRAWTPEDKQYLQKLIDDTRDQFVADVRAARPMIAEETISHMSDGRVVLGTEAAKRKLVDAVGQRQEAVAKAAELAGLKTGAETEVIPMEEQKIPSLLSEIIKTSMNELSHALTRSLGLRQSSGQPQIHTPLPLLKSSETKTSP